MPLPTVTAVGQENEEKDSVIFCLPISFGGNFFCSYCRQILDSPLNYVLLLQEKDKKQINIKSNWLESSSAAGPAPTAEYHSVRTMPSSTLHPGSSTRGM